MAVRSTTARKRPVSHEWPYFDPACRRCPRLVAHLAAVRRAYPDYHAQPVPPFGAADARLLVVGLAPGYHGANATGRPFTGDHAGILLYRTLHAFGFATAPVSQHARDGLGLIDCRITNAVKCLPPANKPQAVEVRECNDYLAGELASMTAGSVVIGLGVLAHRAIIVALGLRQREFVFGHGREHALPGERLLLDSYHCSRYNTQTGRLTAAMFEAVFRRAREFLEPA